MKTALTIAGSDSSGGAGIQADLKSFAANGVFGMSVINSITSQNTTGVFGVYDIPCDVVASQIDAVFKDIFPDLKYFLYRYCNAKRTRFGLDCSGATYTLELHNILKHYCYYRKERNEVLKELPEVIEQTIECDITNKKEYQKAQDDFIEWLSSIDEEAVERALRAEHLVRLSALKDLSIKGKTKFISSFLKEWIEISQEEKLIVFGVRSEPLKMFQKEFSEDSVLVIGEQVTSEKMRRVEEFKS
mgnify:CR=1 FL=1